MNYTDGHIEIPIRIYDGFSLRQAQKKEEELETPQGADWVKGFVDLPIQEVNAFHDFFETGRSMKEVSEMGFDGCVIMTKTLGDFICLWSRERFKKKLNEASDNYLRAIEKFSAEEIRLKQQQFLPQIKKKRWKLF